MREQQDSDDPWVEEGEIGIVPYDDDEIFLVGKLLKRVNPREFGKEDIFSLNLQELLSKDRFEVLAWLIGHGATDASMEAVQLWVDTEWR
jgi:hypothetical protein